MPSSKSSGTDEFVSSEPLFDGVKMKYSCFPPLDHVDGIGQIQDSILIELSSVRQLIP